MYPWHPDVKSFHDESLASGRMWDTENPSLLYNLIPEFMRAEDQLRNKKTALALTQILASYFDSLFIKNGIHNDEFKNLATNDFEEIFNKYKVKINYYQNNL